MESDALARIAAVTGELAAAGTLADVVAVVAEHVCAAVHASVSTLILREGERLLIAGSHGIDVAKADRWASFGLDDDNPASEAVRSGAPVIAATPEQVRSRYPAMAADTPLDRSVVALPLRAADETIGAIGMTFEQNWNPGPSELDFLMTFADACAQAVRRVRATEAETRSATQLEFLASASLELSSSLDYRATLNKVASLSVRTLADWCAVDVVVDGQLTPVALKHVDEDKVAWAWQLRENYPIDMQAPAGGPNVVRTGVSELAPDITDDMLVGAARDEEHLRLCRDLHMRSVLIVPLTARGKTLGTMTLIRSTESLGFTPTDVTIAEDLGRRAGVAVDNAQLYEWTAGVAAQLQRALLPDRLAALPGWQTAAEYRPVGRTEVGGDFFDAVELPDGRLAVFLGDVMGHGITAAAAMAQVRAAIRTLLTIDPDPLAVIGRLDGMFDALAIAPMVSLAYAVLEAGGGVRLGNAGHCPGLILDSSGASLLPHATRPPLGAGTGPMAITETFVEPGGALLLYSDGLVERRAESIDVGIERLLSHAGVLFAGSLRDALVELVDAVAESERHDDVAALCIRRA
jgi:GAF domain-containing protein